MIALVLLLGCREVASPGGPTPAVDPSSAWDAVLHEVVSDDGYVDYDKLATHKDTLDDYVRWINRRDSVPENLRPRFPFWINAYNALVLWSVFDTGRPPSVLDVHGVLPLQGFGFFWQRSFPVDVERVSLHEIEAEHLRGRYLDYRLHATLNCASRSCPPLRNALYTPQHFDRDLDDQMTRWVNDPDRGVRIVDGKLELSPIFEWYAHDFSYWAANQDICKVLARWAYASLRAELNQRESTGCEHTTFDYDWRLNDVHAPK